MHIKCNNSSCPQSEVSQTKLKGVRRDRAYSSKGVFSLTLQSRYKHGWLIASQETHCALSTSAVCRTSKAGSSECLRWNAAERKDSYSICSILTLFYSTAITVNKTADVMANLDVHLLQCKTVKTMTQPSPIVSSVFVVLVPNLDECSRKAIQYKTMLSLHIHA